jgi:hypothetical protein
MGIKEKEDGILVLENLTTSGFRLGPRDKLDLHHILLMTKTLAEFHGSMYALKTHQSESFNNLVKSLRAFPFSSQDKDCCYDAFYGISLKRLKLYADNNSGNNLEIAIMRLYEKYIKKPSLLLQEYLKEDLEFDIIIHGDFNRNNVMFKYPTHEDESPTFVKMFDFQWLKYASPVLDISFYLYMNLDPELFEEKFDEILTFYHENLVSTFKTISISREMKFDENLPFLSYEKFMKHFAKYAFYGCLISTWFLPVMLADEQTCAELATELTKDMFSEESTKVVLRAGGETAFNRVIGNVQHAFKRGYLNEIL